MASPVTTPRQMQAAPSPTATHQAIFARHGLQTTSQVRWNLGVAALYEEALRRQEGQLAEGGALVVLTGQHTGRSPNDKFIVQEPSSVEQVGWGKVNRPFDPARFDALHQRVLAHLGSRDLFIQDCIAGADPAFQRSIRVITETAWHSLFVRTMFLPTAEGYQPETCEPAFTVLHAPTFQAEPSRDGTTSATFILLHFGKRLVIIGGTSYAGEIKKSIFTVMNYLLPLQGVLSMHCAANIGAQGDVALFFGLSGTGKTSLSADPRRTLIGDDEHGWSDHGVFNIEGGCYAKMIRLSPEAEPEIFAATRRFGTVLENVVMDPVTRQLDLNDESLTENTRGAYPISFIQNATPLGRGGHPSNVIMLTCDAFGVLPPIAKLTPAQAMYHFLSGYTAKVAGTEKGITEPQATFSTCFGAPFMVLNPGVYATLLGEKIAKHHVTCWLINTGWTGGPYSVGTRIKISETRAMVEAALNGSLAHAPTVTDSIFGLARISQCPGVSETILDPQATWSDPRAYDAKAKELAAKFQANFAAFQSSVSADILAAQPKG